MTAGGSDRGDLRERKLKVVLGHQAWSEEGMEWHRSMVARARALGWDVEAFCLVPDPPAPHLSFAELDRQWRRRSRKLVRLRERLAEALRGADVFWNFNGANVHPSWLADFETLNVYGCFDDPESTASLSAPVARYYDAALVGNLSCLPMYRSWGIRNLAWGPNAFVGDDFDPELTPEQVLSEERPLDLVFFGERVTPYRSERLEALARAFPQAIFHGRGWPAGYLSHLQRRRCTRQARIGWNLHNSVGPVNLRTFALPASGVLQICDNRCRLGQVYRLGEEVVGFDRIEECIELTRYYLEHEEERRRIAANGLRRYREEYAEPRVWEAAFGHLARWAALKRRGELDAPAWPGRPSPGGSARRLARRGLERVLARAGYRLERSREGPAGDPASPYRERPEAGAVNLSEKRGRAEAGGCFEWPNMVALNWAVASMVGGNRRIAEIGGGTGCFAHEAAADPQRTILCSELDPEASAWAREHRARPNVEYANRQIGAEDGPFDLVVAVDVIEHVADFRGFLERCASLAPRLLVTTPNRRRSRRADTAGPPAYHQHVREWSAGEFYWVLRCFYEKVELYALPDPFVPRAVPISITDRRSPLIARCGPA